MLVMETVSSYVIKRVTLQKVPDDVEPIASVRVCSPMRRLYRQPVDCRMGAANA
jgi:hypothetical protein